MNRVKSLILLILLFFSIVIITGCEKKEANEEVIDNSIATQLDMQFLSLIKKDNDLEKIANEISNNDIIETNVEVVKLDKDSYIPGFKTEVKDFKSGYTVKPMIGSIPFVVYIFEVDNAKEYSETLADNADKRWNICTEADDLKVSYYDNYVFLVMSPSSFE